MQGASYKQANDTAEKECWRFQNADECGQAVDERHRERALSVDAVTVQKKRKTGSINGCVFPFLYLTCVDEFP